jgi:hypothetical protein
MISVFQLAGSSLRAALVVAALFAPDACAQVSVVVQNVDGTSLTGRFEKLSEEEVSVRSDRSSESIAVRDVLRLVISSEGSGHSTEPPPPVVVAPPGSPDPSATPWLLTSTGDWLRVAALMIDDESVVVRWSGFPNQPSLTVPLETCRGTILELPRDPYRQGIEFAAMFDDNQSTDRIVLRNGDRIAGEFAGLESGVLQLETPQGLTTAALETLRSIAFNPELIATPKPPKAHFRAALRDGSVLRLRTALSNGNVLLGELIGGASVSLPLEHVAELWCFDASRVPVSSLSTTDVRLTPYLSVRRPPQFDRNVLGGPLRVRGLPVVSGIGLTSGAEIEFALGGRFRTLLGRVALDDAAGPSGSVQFEIAGDGQKLWHSETVTVDSGLVELPRLSVSEVDRLTLRVSFADRGSVSDIANWCDVVLLKSDQ